MKRNTKLISTLLLSVSTRNNLSKLKYIGTLPKQLSCFDAMLNNTNSRSFSVNFVNRFSQLHNLQRTLIDQVNETCALCGHEGTFTEIASTSAFGKMDLDMRPPPLARHILLDLVKQCNQCGFVHESIQKVENIEKMKCIVNSEKYQQAMKEDNPFLLYAIINEEEQEYLDSAWNYVRSAWVFDDKGKQDNAVISRKRALELYEKLYDSLSQTNKTLMVDLYRRSSQFDKAIDLAQKLLKTETFENKFIVSILEYQKDLCKEQESSCKVVPDEKEFL